MYSRIFLYVYFFMTNIVIYIHFYHDTFNIFYRLFQEGFDAVRADSTPISPNPEWSIKDPQKVTVLKYRKINSATWIFVSNGKSSRMLNIHDE